MDAPRFSRFSRSLALASLALALAAGCDCSASPPPGDACTTDTDCPAAERCRDGRCVARPDGGEREDAGPDAAAPSCPVARTCGDACCEPSETCGGGRCCEVAALCGGMCCGPSRACEADRCVLSCEADETACGTGDAAVCCPGGELCHLGACTTPGPSCARTSDCAEGLYCESTVLRCLPRAMGEACEFRPPTGPFELVELWHWRRDDDVFPTHDQVMMAPMVANLTDDNGDGRIDEHDVPDVVFSTFPGSDYWESGILRIVSGADGSRIWPTGEPGYRTTPGGEVAIADVDPASPGPEILACSASTRASGAPGHLVMLAASGALLRRYDTPPNDVPCGFDAPAVGDMNGDGVPEIVVRYVIASPDGTVVRRIRETTARPYVTLADVTGDGDLELVGPNAVYRYDGTAVWERLGGDGRPAISDSGYPAVADLDLDGQPEIVVTTTDHAIRALDARTGDERWGPVDINPPELAAVIAANGNPNGGGPPTIANFDDDPNPEIAFAGGFAYVVFEHDGSRKWWYETRDRSSRVTGSSIFDFEGDGVAEVLYNDEQTFRVFRGPDGAVLHERCNASGTLWEYPIVVDVNNDGRANIVLMENSYAYACTDGTPSTTGIHVFGHPRGEWVRTRRIFNQHTYHVTNVEEDGTIPRREVRNWTRPRLNNFRQNVQPEGIFDAPDAVLAELSAALTSCPTSIGLSVRVVNRGAAGMPAGIPVTFYLVDGATRTRLGAGRTSRALLPGESELIVLAPPFAVPAGMERATFRFVAVVNDPDDAPVETFRECRSENNTADALEVACPTIG
ncbi:MAG: VCBS repeat-containing protein [Sandaracinaceae bacterium]|nr:VCBS repeat-containing protein [Sandaracinaceae bacterium]